MDNRIVEFAVVVFISTLTFDFNSMVRMQFHRISTSNYALALNAHFVTSLLDVVLRAHKYVNLNATAFSFSTLGIRCTFDFDVHDIEKFGLMFSMSCASKFRRIAFSVIEVCDHPF